MTEDAGVNRAKRGVPDRIRLAKEVQNGIRCARQVADDDNLERELNPSVDRSYGQIASGRLTTEFE